MKKKKEFEWEGYRKVYRKAHGVIPSGWHVHHINGNHKDNRPENLIAIPRSVHVAIHKNCPKELLPPREILEGYVKTFDYEGRKAKIDEKKRQIKKLEKEIAWLKESLR